MGFMANTFGSIQLRITIPEGQTITPEQIAQALNTHSFTPIDEGTEEKSVGWVNLHDPSVTSFTDTGLFCVGHHLAFSLRMDQRKVPAAVLKERCRLAEELWLQEQPGLTRVPKQRREEIKDAQRAKLLAQLPPVPTVYDVVWDLGTGIVTFCNLSQRAIELFQDLFKRTFEGFGLRYITPFDRAVDATMEPPVLLTPQLMSACKIRATDPVLTLLKENEWIGHDFLRWLLWMGHDGGVVRPEFTAYIDQKIILVGAGEGGPQKFVFSGDQSQQGALKAALLSHKQVTVARIYLESEDQTWAFTLRGANFEMASYKCPSVRLEKDDTTNELMERQAVFLERVALVDKGREILMQVFRLFLMDRLTGTWPAVDADINSWLAE